MGRFVTGRHEPPADFSATAARALGITDPDYVWPAVLDTSTGKVYGFVAGDAADHAMWLERIVDNEGEAALANGFYPDDPEVAAWFIPDASVGDEAEAYLAESNGTPADPS